MPTGKVRFYNKDKGWGFISREGEKDIFFGGKFENPEILDRCASATPNTIEVEFFIGAKPDGRSYAYKIKIVEPNDDKISEPTRFADSIGFVAQGSGYRHYDDGMADEYDTPMEY